MPSYDYRCPKCGKIQEVFHGMKSVPKVACPKCKRIMKRQMSAPDFVFVKK